MHRDAIVEEFTHQSAAFNVSPVHRSAETLATLIDLIPAAPDQRWLEVACGPGLIARALAPRVGEVHGVDLTPAMVDLATAEAQRAGITNARFSLADGTALPFEPASYDGAVTRFSLHHIPLPIRCVSEMARVVRPGGWVVLADHVTTEDAEGAAWHQEIERLRDPSHWASLTIDRLRALGEAAGLTQRVERVIPFKLDYEEWITRGSGGEAFRELIERSLADRPNGCECFRVQPNGAGGRDLHLIYWLSLWERRVG